MIFSGSNPSQVPKTIRNLILINVILFVADVLTGGAYLSQNLALVPDLVVQDLQLWRTFTYSLLHSINRPFHILFNMLILWSIGVPLIHQLGEKKFLKIYLFSCLIAGAFTVLVSFFIPSMGSNFIVGASGGISAIFILFVMLNPEAEFLFGVKGKYLAIVWVAIDVLYLTGNDGVAHSTHLGGDIFGFLFFKFGMNGPSLLEKWNAVKQEQVRKKNYSLKNDVDLILKKISDQGMESLNRTEKKILNQYQESKKVAFPSKKKAEPTPVKEADNVDDILQKISETGIDSLTRSEKKRLDQASELKRKKNNTIDFDQFKKTRE